MNSICPKPFVLQTDFPKRGGNIGARFCAPIPFIAGRPSCCLPCPNQKYFYPDRFRILIHSTTYTNLISVICCCFLLLSFAFLAVEHTHRHYLSVCLVAAILLMQVSFIIPFSNPEDQCFDKITPHDMYSSHNCALSGALVLVGGCSTVMWAFLRTVSLHLQICWKVVPGRKFFLGAQAAGWSIPIVIVAIALSVTGVSFRFGESCHINSKNGLKTFWAPILCLSAISIVTQAVTFVYCVQVYLRSLFDEKEAMATSYSGKSGQHTLLYPNSISTATAVQAFRRIQRVVALQWRGLMVIFIIIADSVFFATIFLRIDGISQRSPHTISLAKAWVMCMIIQGGDKDRCLDYAAKMVISEVPAISVLFLLSLNGIWALVLLGQVSMFKGWVEFFRNIFGHWKRRRSAEFGLSDNSDYNAFVLGHHSSSKTCVSSTQLSSIEFSDVSKTKRYSNITTNPNITTTSTSLARQTSLGNSNLQEYNPSTFSAHLRERSDIEATRSSISSTSWPPTPFSPFRADGLSPPPPPPPSKSCRTSQQPDYLNISPQMSSTRKFSQSDHSNPSPNHPSPSPCVSRSASWKTQSPDIPMENMIEDYPWSIGLAQ